MMSGRRLSTLFSRSPRQPVLSDLRMEAKIPSLGRDSMALRCFGLLSMLVRRQTTKTEIVSDVFTQNLFSEVVLGVLFY